MQAATAGESGSGDSPSSTSAAASTTAAVNVPGGSAAGTASATSDATSATPVIAGAKPAPTAAAAAAAESGIVDQLLEEPLLPAIGLGLVALLAGFGFYRSRQRRDEERAFIAERGDAPESFFGVSGGQEVDAQQDQTSHGSSVLYSASQLDAGGEVDPVAEADVYLAYGRDQQAIDALKEAIRVTPDRVTARTKLLEIHARRGAASEFKALAAETLPVVGANSPEWQRISELGRDFDFANPLYQSAGANAAPAARASATGATTMPSVLGADLDTGASTSGTVAASFAATSLKTGSNTGWDLPFDLDLDLTPQPGHAAARGAYAASQPLPLDTNCAPLDLDLSDFGGLEPTPKAGQFAPKSNSPKGRPSQFSSDAGNWVSPPTRPAPLAAKDPAPVSAATVSAPMSGMIDFDFSSLRLDLDPPAPAAALAAGEPATTTMEHSHADVAEATSVASVEDDDALSTKLALAEAFSAIGDVDGARSLAQEVVGGSNGQLKDRAQRFLSSIR